MPLPIYIFTDHDPRDAFREPFLREELRVATREFDPKELAITIVPLKPLASNATIHELGEQIAVAPALLMRWRGFRFVGLLFRLLFTGAFWRFVGGSFQRIATKKRVCSVRAKRYFAAEMVAKYIQENAAAGEFGVLYSYWFSHAALGISLARVRMPKLKRWKAISRAHGYEIRDGDEAFPLRGLTFRNLDRVYCVSAAGAESLKLQYPKHTAKIEVARLGIDGVSVVSNSIEKETTLHFLSCSLLVPVKRVQEGLLKLITAYAMEHSNQQILWEHIGDGPLYAPLREAATEAQKRSPNLTIRLLGAMLNAHILRYYTTLGRVIFVNSSESEGLPVTIMEALSAGFPVIATDVGGSGEALQEGAGELIGKDLDYSAFASSVDRIASNYEEYSTRARETFEKHFQSTNNYRAFYERLMHYPS